MLRLMIGKAGAGKTAAIINEIKRDMASAHGRALMIVPEQYSHEAERELCRVCGDRLSLYAEVLSFTGLARETAAKHGGGAEPWLDKGGRLLCMALALQSVGSRLRIYSAAQRRAELQALLLSAVDELKSACIGYDALMTAAASCPDSLGDKLSDLALILEAYDAAVANGHADPADRLTILARQIDESTDIDVDVKIYVDGFIDFTRQEREILHAMLRRGAQLTVCLTVDALDGDNEIFELSRRAGRELLAYARELGSETEIVTLSEQSAKAPELTVFADNMFSYSNDKYTPARDAIRLYRTESMAAECEQAAALCLEFARDGGCRWRDIAVVARGFEDYRGSLESAFRHYGVPLFTARRDDLMSKPLPALIALAFEIVRGGWAVDDVISYMRTGLAGLAPAECDTLENYIFKWQLQGGAWHRSADWRQHPDGYGCEYTDETKETLRRVNALRRTLAAPILAFEEATAKAQTAAQQLVVSVGQKMRLSVSEPVMDASSLYAGDSLDVALQVVNEGRTTLYNVSVAPESASENLTLPTAAYLGNMEGGTSKRAELSLTPTKEGDYKADLIVTWEDALGEKYTEKRSISFSAQADETIDYSGSTGGNPADYYSNDINGGNDVDSAPETDASAILSMLPWWVYAAAAGLYFVIVIYAAMSVRARRRKALEDDEMD